jgi:glucose/arabinose dehydrogenase
VAIAGVVRSAKNYAAGAALALGILANTIAAAEVDLGDIRLPPGFKIEVFADIPSARSLALGNNGTVFVSTRRADRVYAVVPRAAGKPDVVILADDLDMPNGIAFHDGDLYVAENSRVSKYPGIESSLYDVPEAEVLDIELPDKSHHGSRYIGFGPDEKLYIAIGAPCNVCDRDGFGMILRMNPDGSNREVYAKGIRNSVGFTWHPDSDELWFTDNGRDRLGDDLPADELNRAPSAGLHFGFPYCHAGEILDPEYGRNKSCAKYTAPEQKLGPHVASLGIAFYTGSMFPPGYQGQLFVAEHGSWNRSDKIGYQISIVKIQQGRAVAYEPFAVGWLQGQSVSGRPVDVLQIADGSLLVSDDHAGKIYRISYKERSN